MIDNRRLLPYALIAIGGIALIGRVTDDPGWLWIGLVSAGFLYAWTRERAYGLLVVGSVLAGVAAGLLLEGNWGWEGAFLVALGGGIAMIDRLEPRPGRWPVRLGAVVAGLGLLYALIRSGALGSTWFALLLIVVGVALLRRSGPRSGWTWAPPRPDGAEPAGSAETAADPAAPGTTGAPEVPTSADAPPTPPAAPAAPATPPDPADRPAPPATTPAATPAATPEAAADPVADAADPAADPATPATATDATATDGAVARRAAALEAWRERTAAAEGRSPALVLPGPTLEALAREAPADLEALGGVRGIGPVKLERYGAELLEVLRNA